MAIIFETPESIAKREAQKDHIYKTLTAFSKTKDQLFIPEPVDPASLFSIKVGAENALLTDQLVVVDTETIVKKVVKSAGLAIEAMAYGDISMRQKNRQAENMWRDLFESAAHNMFVSHDDVRIMRTRCYKEIKKAREIAEISGVTHLETGRREHRMNVFMETVFDKYHINGRNDDAYLPKRKAQPVTKARPIIN